MPQIPIVVRPVQVMRGYPILAAWIFARAVAQAPFILATIQASAVPHVGGNLVVAQRSLVTRGGVDPTLRHNVSAVDDGDRAQVARAVEPCDEGPIAGARRAEGVHSDRRGGVRGRECIGRVDRLSRALYAQRTPTVTHRAPAHAHLR